MAIKKIPCGGWLYDDEQITFEDGVMKVIGGGSGGSSVIIVEVTEELEGEYKASKTGDEICEELKNNNIIRVKFPFPDTEDVFLYGDVVYANFATEGEDARKVQFFTLASQEPITIIISSDGAASFG